MLPINVALLSQSKKVPLARLMEVGAALQKQITRDFQPVWNIPATVAAFDKAPLGYWPITVMDQLDDPDAGGYHDNEADGQPYSVVLADDDWTVSASHELIEMLVDPYGKRFCPGWINGKRVQILVEACDPCEADDCTYTIDGVKVSDFMFPRYFEPVQVAGERYCFSGRLDGPRELHRDGYCSWLDDQGEWWQRDLFGAKPAITHLGKLDIKNGSWRSQIDRLTRKRKLEVMGVPHV